MSRDETIEIEVTVRDESDDGWQLDDGTRVAWFPKSQVTDNGDGTFSMPEWLAKDREFI